MNQKALIIFYILILVIFTSCNKDEYKVEIVGIKILNENLIVVADSSKKIEVEIVPNNATNQSISWQTGDENIAVVDEEGNCRGVNPGKVLIKAIVNDEVYAECYINVIKWRIYNKFNSSDKTDINSLAMDSIGNIWMSGPEISKYDGNSFASYPNIGGYPVTVSANGNVLLNQGYNFLKYDGEVWDSFELSSSGLSNNAITALVGDRNDYIWLSHYSRDTWKGTGVTKFTGGEWSTYNSSNGLIDDNVLSIGIDHEDNKWFLTSEGISVFDGNEWSAFTSEITGNELVNWTYLMATDIDNNKWFGTVWGVLKYDGSIWTSFTHENSDIQEGQVRSIACDKEGNVWVGLDWGVAKFDGISWLNFHGQEFDLYSVDAILVDNNNKKWFGASRGLYVLED